MSKTIRLWRMENGMSQHALAEALGITQKEISRWESHYSKKIHYNIGEKNGKKIERFTNGEVRWPDSWTKEAQDACPYTRITDLRSITSIHSVANMNEVNARRRHAHEEGQKIINGDEEH